MKIITKNVVLVKVKTPIELFVRTMSIQDKTAKPSNSQEDVLLEEVNVNLFL